MAEIQEASGVAISVGTPNPTNKLVCDSKIGATGSSVSLLLTRETAVDTAERTVSELQKRKIQASAITKIGEGAYSASPRYGVQQMGAYKGSSHIVVTVFILGTPEAKAKAVAEKVVRKALTSLL